MATLADEVFMNPAKLKPGLLLMVEFPRPPVGLRMADAALFLKLTLMRVLMAVYTLLGFGPVTLAFVALGAKDVLVLAYKRELGLDIVVKRYLFPVRCHMAFFAIAAKLFLMDVVLGVTTQTIVR